MIVDTVRRFRDVGAAVRFLAINFPSKFKDLSAKTIAGWYETERDNNGERAGVDG